jgi:glycine hydroxymethyltransferase
MTTRGFKDEEARMTANLIADVLDNPRDQSNIAAVRQFTSTPAAFPYTADQIPESRDYR